MQLPQNNVSQLGSQASLRSNRSLSREMLTEKFEDYVTQLNNLFNCGAKLDKSFLRLAQESSPAWVESFYPSFDWRHLSFDYTQALFLLCKRAKDGGSNLFQGLNHQTFSGVVSFRQKKNMHTTLQINQTSRGASTPIAVLPTQLGSKYYSSSPLQVQKNPLPDEVGLSTFQALTIIILEPEILRENELLPWMCLEDRFGKDEHGVDFAPTLFFHDKALRLDRNLIDKTPRKAHIPTFFSGRPIPGLRPKKA